MRIINNTPLILQGLFIFLLFAFNCLYGQSATEIKIQPGDKPPAITELFWLKGQPIVEFKKNNIYVIYFTAVGCPPCRKSIPHLSDLANMYAGKVSILSVYVRESNKQDSTEMNYLESVKNLLMKLNNKISFLVAADVPRQITADAWGVQGTPTIYVINNEGKIAWSGYNSNSLDDILSKLLDGKFKSIDEQEAQSVFLEKLQRLQMLKDGGFVLQALRYVDNLAQDHPDCHGILYTEKFKILLNIDETKAYNFLRWMLTQKIKGFAWEKFLDDTWMYSKKPDSNWY